MHAKSLEILGLRQGATSADIKRAYRMLVRKYHPDVNPSPDAHQQFLQIQHAYDQLTTSVPKARANAPTTPRPTNDPAARRREKVKAYQEMRRKKAAEEKARYSQKVKSFRNGPFYVPALLLYLGILAVVIGVSMALFLMPFVMILFFETPFWYLLLFFPVLLFGIGMAKYAYDAHQNIFADIFFNELS
jgi:hypothetical protein